MTELETLLAKAAPFAGLPTDVLTPLAGRMRRRKLPGATPIVYRGDPASALYVVLTGRVKVHLPTARGDEVILEILGAGSVFGEMGLLEGQPRAADVSTLEPTELAVLDLDSDSLRRTVKEQPEVAWALLRVLSHRLREQNEKIEMLMTRDVAGRVAGLLLRLSELHGAPVASDSKRTRIEVSLTQSDIAAFVGATRERVSRALTAFRTSGAIVWDKNGGHWIVCNRAALRRRAEMD